MARFHARTDVGLRRRHNEDALLALDDHGVFVVADGVGGRKAGELASAITVDTFQTMAPKLAASIAAYAATPDLSSRKAVLALLDATANKASNRVFETAAATARQGMTTTLAAMAVGGGSAFVVHVGDSRVYLLRDGQLRQLTEDHSLVNEMIRSGSLTVAEAARSRYRNVITRAVGLYPQVQADVLHVELVSGDRLLICSDGLSDMVPTDELLATIRKPDVRDAVEALVDAALTHGGKDNVSVIGLDPEATANAAAVAARAQVMEDLFLFADLPFQARTRVGRIVSDRSAAAGDVLVRQGETGSTMYVVVDGTVRVEIDGATVTTLGAGEHFGELSLVDDAPRSATIVADTPVHLLAIERDDLRSFCTQDPPLGTRVLWKLIATLGNRLRHTNELLSSGREGRK